MSCIGCGRDQTHLLNPRPYCSDDCQVLAERKREDKRRAEARRNGLA